MIIWAVWQKLKWHLEISTDTPLASLSDSRSQQPISFLIKRFRSSWGFCLVARMITCSRGRSRATTHACDLWPCQFLVTAISNIKKYLDIQWKFLPEFRGIFWYYVFRGMKSDFNPCPNLSLSYKMKTIHPLEKQLSIINIDLKSVLKVFESKGPPLIDLRMIVNLGCTINRSGFKFETHFGIRLRATTPFWRK